MTIAWTIAGSDSGGNAGIQADLHTFQALGVKGCSVITTVTAQNSLSITDIHYLPESQVQSQISTLAHDLPANAIKIGMIGDISIINVIKHFLQSCDLNCHSGQRTSPMQLGNGHPCTRSPYHPWSERPPLAGGKFTDQNNSQDQNCSATIILDPVLIATAGKNLFAKNASDYLFALKSLFPFVDLLTPNIPEAEALLNQKIVSFSDIKNAAVELLKLGAKSVLIKGGHFNQDNFCHDYWTDGKDAFWLSSERIQNSDTHGTGCTLSSAIAACCAQGYSIKDALVIGKMYITQAIRHATKQGQGLSSLAHLAWPENQEDLPYLTAEPFTQKSSFLSCGPQPLGLYPIVDHSQWLERLLPIGVTTIQLRIKNKSDTELDKEIQKAVALANRYQARLFINDHWQLALHHKAYGVHLGQEDLDNANIDLLHQAGIRLGISSHCYYEVARAHAIQPSYMACGPIFPTTIKQMPFAPQGLAQLARWQRTLHYPIVAIGGINHQRLVDIRSMGIEGIAMISEICQANEPEKVTQKLLEAYNNAY